MKTDNKPPAKKPKEPLCVAIGANIKSAREHSQLSREQLAQELGLKPRAIGMQETGHRYPTVPNVYRMAKLLRTRVYDLLPLSLGDIEPKRTTDLVDDLPRKSRERVRRLALQEMAMHNKRRAPVSEQLEDHGDQGVSFRRSADASAKHPTARHLKNKK
jgi:transcriptional regulator with XRE-family HTH domain